ncbi:hypothetical protein K7X08_022216 [Anisodus acutangulus]|uniref:protein-serine/threonine phosphatase n=1 Tax=Anisodus acutangulus TaxID=402998 RepID=A0A9Q1QU36_9SOLA|nr:hypothetical protein K7X08_022216 [Anisodus acutangulus]
MGSCLSFESRSPLSGSARTTSKEELHRIPGRMFLNGSSEVASIFTQQGKKGPNQDAMIVWENFGSRTDTVFCGVFDGHGPHGHFVAKRVRDCLPLKLRAEWEDNIKDADYVRETSPNTRSSLYSEDASFISADEESRVSFDVEETEKHPEVFQTLKDSFLKAYKFMDRELRSYNNINCFCSGTTAVTLVKQGQDLVIGNIGDSRAVLAMRDMDGSLVAVQLTVDLKPNLPVEAERIRKCKGRVFSLRNEPDVARVWLPNSNSPGLAMARAFGDFCLKDFGLISVPEISYRLLTEKDQFIVLATDGIWDVLSNEEVVNIVASASLRSFAARSLVEAAVLGWRTKYPTSKVDDCAVVCLFLDSNSIVSSTACSTKQDDKTIREGDEILEKQKEEVSDLEELLSEEEENRWSALGGVSRANTLLTLPKFIPDKE